LALQKQAYFYKIRYCVTSDQDFTLNRGHLLSQPAGRWTKEGEGTQALRTGFSVVEGKHMCK